MIGLTIINIILGQTCMPYTHTVSTNMDNWVRICTMKRIPLYIGEPMLAQLKRYLDSLSPHQLNKVIKC